MPSKRMLFAACLFLLPLPAAHGQSNGALAPECKWEPVDFAGRPERSYYCLGADGVWHAQRPASTGDTSDNNADRDDDRDGNSSTDDHGAPPTAAYVPPAPVAPVSVTPLDRELDAIVKLDSASWMFNHYNAGSMTNTKVLARSRKGYPTSIYGEYTFNQGARGWVKVKMNGNNVGCVQFWDDGSCRPLGQSLSRRVTAAMARAASQPPSNSDSRGLREIRDRQRAEQAERDAMDRAAADYIQNH